jgi:hypothetical protein
MKKMERNQQGESLYAAVFATLVCVWALALVALGLR